MSQVKSDQAMDPSKASPENGEKTTTELVAVDTSDLNAESLNILNQIIAAEDIDKTKDLKTAIKKSLSSKTDRLELALEQTLTDKLLAVCEEVM